MNQNQIPAPVIAVVSELVSHAESHASLDNLFMYAEAFGPTPDGSKPVKATAWLRATNKAHQDPLAVLGRLISGYMEDPEMDPNFVMNSWGSTDHKETTRNHVRKLEAVLERCSLKYQAGGYVTRGGLAPSKTLAELIKGRDMPSIHREFDKAMETVESNPREAVTASSNILESIFKIYIEDNKLAMPAKQDLQQVFKVVRADLGLKPESIEDQDLQRIITGIFSVVDGVGSLRTHAGSAHSEGRKTYNLEPRHARLAVNSAHTVATFIMESWDKKTKN